MNETQPIPKKRHGCLFYGCMTVLVLMAIVTVAGLIALHAAYKWANTFIADYTETQAVELPKSELSAAELAALRARWTAFQQSLAAHTNTPPISLTGPEFDALLAEGSGDQSSNHYYVTIEGDQIKGRVSLPLEGWHIPFLDLKGRYLNGSGAFNAGVSNQTLWVTVDTLEVKGKTLPKKILDGLKTINLAENMQANGTNEFGIGRYGDIVVKDGKMILTPGK
jgi:hypothetical protein